MSALSVDIDGAKIQRRKKNELRFLVEIDELPKSGWCHPEKPWKRG